MYRITYVHKNSSTENVLYIPGDDTYSIISGKLDLEMGKAGSLTLSLQSNNPARNEVVCLTDEIIVYRRNQEIFRGRAITSQEDFNLTGTLVIEGCLAYLFDTWYGPFDFHDKPSVLLASLLENHNSLVENRKKIQLGNVTVTDKNDYIYRASEDYMRTLEVLTSRFSDTSLGGYFRIRIANGTKYLDYLQSYATTASQTVEFGSNILDIAQKIEYGDLITALIPLGKKDDQTGEYVTLDDVTPGNIYIRDQNLINVYGFICDVVHWEDVEEASNLLTKGREYLNQASVAIQTMEIKAVDLALADPNITSLNIGDSVHVVSAPHHINQWIELAGLTLDLVDPRNDVLTFGATSTSFVSKSVSSNRQMANNLSDLTVNFHKVAADYITTEYLTANYVAARNLEAEVAKFGYATVADLTVANGRITNLEAGRATITELNAAVGRIGILESDYGNISTLLSGNAGVGDLQVIHLTAANSVFDTTLVRNLVAQNVSVSDLLAGTIDTSKFRIASPNNTIVIEDGTQTFSDGQGNVRLQLGEDATGNFTFVLYDATGQGILIDSTGIKESAIADGLIKNAKVANDANISASKLNIASLFNVINNDSNYTIYANKIWFDDESQTLNQIYSQMSSDISDADDKADDAKAIAQTANANADAAIRAIEGISSLDNVTAVLSNDSHVVHTNYDGSGGVYTYASTQVSAYKGDADISSAVTITCAASSGLTGTWNASTRTYQVTNLTSDNGYVDFTVNYTPQNGNPVTVTKRFSVSKAPDGRAGSAYNLQTSVLVMQKTTEGVFNPSTVTFSAIVSIGPQSTMYSGKYKIEESVDGTTWVQKYVSSAVEVGKTYTPTSTASYIRCTLMDENNVYLDSQTITVIADSAEISESVDGAKAAVMNLSTRVGTVETGINGLRVDLSRTNTELQGVSDNTLLYQAIADYTDNDAVTVRAKVYKAGDDVHTDYPQEWFSWHKKSEEGMRCIGTGYTVQVNKSDYEYSGSLVGRFTTFNEDLLIFPNGDIVTMPDDQQMMVYYQ